MPPRQVYHPPSTWWFCLFYAISFTSKGGLSLYHFDTRLIRKLWRSVFISFWETKGSGFGSLFVFWTLTKLYADCAKCDEICRSRRETEFSSTGSISATEGVRISVFWSSVVLIDWVCRVLVRVWCVVYVCCDRECVKSHGKKCLMIRICFRRWTVTQFKGILYVAIIAAGPQALCLHFEWTRDPGTQQCKHCKKDH